jgi:hypothetical protein
VWKRNVGTEIRKLRLERERLEMRKGIGWVRKEGVGEHGFSKEENKELEIGILMDFGISLVDGGWLRA